MKSLKFFCCAVLLLGFTPGFAVSVGQEEKSAPKTQDSDSVDWSDFRGRYVHLLIRQTPNKPIWKLSPDETIEWQAVTIQPNETITLLAYSSLPKCVEFMQSAVIAGWVQDVNKVGKFKKESMKCARVPQRDRIINGFEWNQKTAKNIGKFKIL